jgi:hypothetical protein
LALQKWLLEGPGSVLEFLRKYEQMTRTGFCTHQDCMFTLLSRWEYWLLGWWKR